MGNMELTKNQSFPCLEVFSGLFQLWGSPLANRKNWMTYTKYKSTAVHNSVTSQMRIAMVMIQTVLHLVTSVSSSTYGTNDCNSTNEKNAIHQSLHASIELNDGLALTTIADATDGATKPGIDPMQLVSPRIVPLMKTILFCPGGFIFGFG